MKRKNREDKDNQHPAAGWQTIYCSLSLIMVVLFVMFVSYSKTDWKKMADLRGTFKTVAHERDLKESPPKPLVDLWVEEVMDSLRKTALMVPLQGQVTAEKTEGGVKLKFESDGVFPSGSARLSEKVYPYLQIISKATQENDLFLRVAGHTDNVPIHTPEFPSNWELSAARAISVLRYVLKEEMIPEERLVAEGFGQYRPLTSNDTPAGRGKNRRIEIYMEAGQRTGKGQAS